MRDEAERLERLMAEGVITNISRHIGTWLPG
jgi:hypothetical protein